MTFQEYQLAARKTAVYPNQGSNYIYPTLGLVGEAGEVAEKIKKVIRDEQQVMTPEKIQELSKELGDVLWYIAQLSTELGLDLEDVASGNIQKLQSRLERGVTHGSGDNR
ncbi:nucleoside triphosphate pyrophosphohydrolase family protein [Patescibacteria group bacterium]|nr:nucleoside triphosphate pyrophosphohydrolase family protein [Patescibacteria group bacterium]